jgi:hypothetical protein
MNKMWKRDDMAEDLLNCDTVEEGLQNLQALNDRIRKIEMTRSGERIKILSLLAIIGVIIYLMFNYMVDGLDVLLNPQIPILMAYALGVLAIVIRAFSTFRKAALVHECNNLIAQRKILEKALNDRGAFLEGQSANEVAMQNKAAVVEKSKPVEAPQPAKKPELPAQPGSNSPDLIKEFANKKKRRPNRLSIRDDSE